MEYEAENPLHCHLCEKGISPEIYQLYHMDTAHVDRAEYTGERPETCGACGKKFEDKETLMNHFYKTHRQIYFMVYTSDIQLTKLRAQKQDNVAYRDPKCVASVVN